MGEYNRSTSQKMFEAIPTGHMQAIQEHIEYYNIKPDLEKYLICIETFSKKKKKPLFGGMTPNQTHLVAIVTPTWLITATQGDKPNSIGVLSIQLKDAHPRDYKDDPGYQLVQDTGVFVTGIFTGRVGMPGNAEISSFVPLGEEPIAEQFKEILFEAVDKARTGK